MRADTLILKETRRGKIIRARIYHSDYGIFGSCYSQSKKRVEKLCEQTATRIYPTETRFHELGQWTVDVVLSALNALPNIKAWQTPPNSLADNDWKWDVIIEHQDDYYPVQVKSGLDAIRKTQQTLYEVLEEKQYKIRNRMEGIGQEIKKIEQQYETRIKTIMRSYGLTSRKNATIVEIKKEKDRELQPLKELYKQKSEISKIYSKLEPLYIWTSRDEDSVIALNNHFTKLFSIEVDSEELKEKALNIYRKKNQDYQEKLIQEETDKIEYISKIVKSLNQYLAEKENYLSEQRRRSKKKRKILLEDILTHKISQEALKIANKLLKECNLFIKIITPKSSSNNIEYSSDINTKTNTSINYNADYSRKMYTQNYHLRSKESDINLIYRKIKTLINFDKGSSKPMLSELSRLIDISHIFAEKFDIFMINCDKKENIDKNITKDKTTKIIRFLTIQQNHQQNDVLFDPVSNTDSYEECGM